MLFEIELAFIVVGFFTSLYFSMKKTHNFEGLKNNSSLNLINNDKKFDVDIPLLMSQNGAYVLLTDKNHGSLSIYNMDEMNIGNVEAIWKSSFRDDGSDKGLYKIVLQPNGNIVVFDKKREIVWSVFNNNEDLINKNVRLVLQNTGKLELLGEKNNCIWRSTTNIRRYYMLSDPNNDIEVEPIMSNNRRYVLSTSIMKGEIKVADIYDGVTDDNYMKVIWKNDYSSFNIEKSPYRIIFEKTGILSVYDKNNNKVWSTVHDKPIIKFSCDSIYKLILSDEGKLSIYDVKKDTKIWSS